MLAHILVFYPPYLLAHILVFYPPNSSCRRGQYIHQGETIKDEDIRAGTTAPSANTRMLTLNNTTLIAFCSPRSKLCWLKRRWWAQNVGGASQEPTKPRSPAHLIRPGLNKSSTRKMLRLSECEQIDSVFSSLAMRACDTWAVLRVAQCISSKSGS